jgi:lipid A 3-O-deacylase
MTPPIARFVYLFLLVILYQSAFGQKENDHTQNDSFHIPKKQFHFRNETMLISENDNYALQLRDGYYTNGFMLRFSRAKDLSIRKNKKSLPEKIVQRYELGQMIMNPVRFDSLNVATQDRPFAGYLYARFEQFRFYGANSMWQWSGAVGTIGTYSYAQQVQRWYHNAMGIYDVKGWSTQLHNEWSINFGTQYAHSFFKKPQEQRRYDIAGTGQANLGNAFTDVGAGLLFRAGLMENYSNSAHWAGRVSSDQNKAPKHHRELYFFVHPFITWQAYNAVLEGGAFTKDKGPKLAEPAPFYVTTHIGFKFAQNRWTWGMQYITRSRQAKNQMLKENLVSIQLAYSTGKFDKPTTHASTAH